MTIGTVASTDVGIFVQGELLSVTEGNERTFPNGDKRTPGLVKLLVQDQALTVEFWGLREAQAAVGDAERGDLLRLRAYATAFKDRVYWKASREQAG